MSRKQHIDNLRTALTSSFGYVILDEIEQYDHVSQARVRQLQQQGHADWKLLRERLHLTHYAATNSGSWGWSSALMIKARNRVGGAGGVTLEWLKENVPKMLRDSTIQQMVTDGYGWCSVREAWCADGGNYGAIIRKMQRGERFGDKEVAELNEREQDKMCVDAEKFGYKYEASSRWWEQVRKPETVAGPEEAWSEPAWASKQDDFFEQVKTSLADVGRELYTDHTISTAGSALTKGDIEKLLNAEPSAVQVMGVPVRTSNWLNDGEFFMLNTDKYKIYANKEGTPVGVAMESAEAGDTVLVNIPHLR